MMPESSTIRHVFMLSSLCQRADGLKEHFLHLPFYCVALERELPKSSMRSASSATRIFSSSRNTPVAAASSVGSRLIGAGSRSRSARLSTSPRRSTRMPNDSALRSIPMTICALVSLGASSSSRWARSITVTMRPRKLRTPAISRPASVGQRENVLNMLDRQPEQLTRSCEGNVIGHLPMSPKGSCRATERATAGQEKLNVDDFGRDASHERVTKYASSIGGNFEIEPFLGDVDDLIDEETNRAALFREHKNKLGSFPLDPHLHVEAKERHQRVAVFRNVSSIGDLDISAVDLLDPAHKRQRHCFWPVRRRTKNQKRDGVVSCLRFAFGGVGRRFAWRGRGTTKRLCKHIGVDDQNNRAVAKDGHAGKYCDVPQLRRHRLAELSGQ